MTEKILAVQRMQDYIALHLREDITLADLAREACYSPWYAANRKPNGGALNLFEGT